MKRRNKLVDKYVKATKAIAFIQFSVVMGGIIFPIVTFCSFKIAESNIEGSKLLAVFVSIAALTGCGFFLFSAFFYALRRFREMIHRQEAMYSTVFSDTNCKNVGINITISDEWLIHGSQGAYYYEYIKHASYNFRTIQIENSYPDRVFSLYKTCEVFDIALTTADGETCEIPELWEEDFEEVKSWLNDKCKLKL